MVWSWLLVRSYLSDYSYLLCMTDKSGFDVRTLRIKFPRLIRIYAS